MFNLIRTTRIYLGMTQRDFAKHVNMTQANLCDLESKTSPYGSIAKYRRVADFLGIPVDVLMRNDFCGIPGEFFDRFPEPVYTDPPDHPDARLGRAGEEYALDLERQRLSLLYPTLAKLVLPHFKLDGPSPGYDILSYDNFGAPYALEVKTSATDTSAFRLTTNEYRTAQKITDGGGNYSVMVMTNFGNDKFACDKLSFEEVTSEYNVRPVAYSCIRKPQEHPISGLAYHRQMAGITQTDLAPRLGIARCSLTSMETGNRTMPAALYLKTSDILGVPVDDLLKTYSSRDLEVPQ